MFLLTFTFFILIVPQNVCAERRQIVYNLNGGTFTENVSTEWVVGSVRATPSPVRDNYTFIGWYNNAEFSGKPILFITKESDLVLFAKWKSKCIHNITYELAGGTDYGENYLEYDGLVGYTPKNVTRRGYLFGGWYSDSDYKTRIMDIKPGTNYDVTLVAKWIKVTPKKMKINKVKSKHGKRLAVSFRSITGAEGYQLEYSQSKCFIPSKTQQIELDTSVSKKTIKRLSANKKYYVHIRCWQLDSTGKRVYGKWSNSVRQKVIR